MTSEMDMYILKSMIVLWVSVITLLSYISYVRTTGRVSPKWYDYILAVIIYLLGAVGFVSLINMI